MSSMSKSATDRVLQAAMTLFARYGFQRTSMADVAAEAKVARATLYLRYRDKRALFEGLAEWLVDEALAAAEAAWSDGAGLAANLEGAILAKDLPLWRLLHAPHGSEMLALDADLTRRHVERLDAGFAALLSRRADEQAGLDFSVFEGAAGFGSFLATAAAGLKHETRTEDAYAAAIRRLCAVSAKAARPMGGEG